MTAGIRAWVTGSQWSLAYLAGYVLLDWISFVHPVVPLGITPWNPPAGLTLFFLLRAGVGYWPVVYAAALAADVIVRGIPVQFGALLVSAGMIAAVYAAVAALLGRWLGRGATLESPRDLALFVFVVAPATLVLSTAFVGWYTLLDAVPGADLAGNIMRYWIGDLNGILVLAPALLAHDFTGPAWPRPQRAALEISLQGMSTVLALWAVFAVADTYEFRFFSLLFLPLVWVAARWGLRGATLALVGIQLGLIVAVQLARYHSATFIQLQFLMIALCITGLVLGAVVTQRQRAEAQLQDRQAALGRALQLAAAGEMASALAHELNQPLAALVRYLGACEVLARSASRDDGALAENMTKAASEARRAADVVRRLRDFYRSGAVEVGAIAPVDLVQAAARAVEGRASRAGIRLAVHSAGRLPLVAVDPVQVETALQNVLNNAIDALADAPPAARSIDVQASLSGDRVSIVIRDSGPGVAAAIAGRLFEPFTTSKPGGMGMGLAISRTLVQASGGSIVLERPGGPGATFVIALPVARDDTA